MKLNITKIKSGLKYTLLGALFWIGVPNLSFAEEDQIITNSNAPLPRFVSLRSNEVNLRKGPGVKYPIEWVLIKKDMPVKITAEFDHWRRVVTKDGTTGWTHKVMLSGHRRVIIDQDQAYLYDKPAADSKQLALLERDVEADFKKCENEWCQITIEKLKGWVERKALWGVLDWE